MMKGSRVEIAVLTRYYKDCAQKFTRTPDGVMILTYDKEGKLGVELLLRWEAIDDMARMRADHLYIRDDDMSKAC